MATARENAVFSAGGEDRICAKCRPFTEKLSAFLGLKPHLDGPNCTGVHTQLDEAIANATTCWICGWMASLVQARISESRNHIATTKYSAIKVHISSQITYLYEKVSDDQQVLNRLVMLYDPRSLGHPIEYVLYLQKCDQSPKYVASMLNQSELLGWPNHEPYIGRIRPIEADCRLFNSWRDCCINSHGGACNEASTKLFTQSVRLVDVVDQCIVEHSQGVQWVALSYCWGGPQHQSLRLANLDYYKQRGTLTEERLPPGIWDAISVTKALGERYIWIDSMCIIQDDDKDKLTYLNIMGAIYAHAALTIINAASSRVTDGIPGITRLCQRREQIPFQLNDVWLVEALDPPHAPFSGFLENTKWDSRGWTFQEGLLSPRCLIFATDQVYWQCNKSSWCEDSFWEGSYSATLYRHFSGQNNLKALTHVDNEDWVKIYTTILERYTQKEFSVEADRLHALEGVLGVLGQTANDEHFWGLPKDHMELALGWLTYELPARRDCSHKTLNSNGELTSSTFPTWSWVGWKGSIDMNSIRRSVLSGMLGLKFFRINSQGVPEPLAENSFAGATRIKLPLGASDTSVLDDQIGYPHDAIHSWMDPLRNWVEQRDVPASVLLREFRPALLCFWTSTAILQMENQGWNDYHNCSRILTSYKGVQFYAAWERDKTFEPDRKFGKFIVIGTERIRPSRGGQVALKLLFVDVDEDNICLRRKLLTEVLESDWNALENKKWELVFLA